MRHLLFITGNWLAADNERVIISQSDELCSSARESAALNGTDSESVPSRPGEATSLLIRKILSGLTKILLNKSDHSSTAIITAWKGNDKTASLLSLWDKDAIGNAGVMYTAMVTEKKTRKGRGEAEYLYWLGRIMVGCLVFAQTKKVPSSDYSPDENLFIKWAQRLPKLLRLLQLAGMTGLLILTAIGNCFYTFTELDRMPETNFESYLKTEWAHLKPILSYLYYRLRGTPVFDRKIPIFNPVAFCCHYLQLQLRVDIDYREMCGKFGADDWVKAKCGVFERKTMGELLAAQEDSQLDLSLYSTSSMDSKEWKGLVAALDELPRHDQEPQPTSAAERQTPPSGHGTTSRDPSHNISQSHSTSHDYTSPHTANDYRRDDGNILEEPGVRVENEGLHENSSPSGPATGSFFSGSTRSGWAVNQLFSMPPVQGPEAHAGTAGFVFRRDADSGYGSGPCSQVSGAAAGSEAENGGDSVHVVAGQKRPQIKDHVTSKRRHVSNTAETTGAAEDPQSTEDSESTRDSEASQCSQDSNSSFEPSTTQPAVRFLLNSDSTAPTTTVSTNPSQDEALEELAGINGRHGNGARPGASNLPRLTSPAVPHTLGSSEISHLDTVPRPRKSLPSQRPSDAQIHDHARPETGTTSTLEHDLFLASLDMDMLHDWTWMDQQIGSQVFSAGGDDEVLTAMSMDGDAGWDTVGTLTEDQVAEILQN